MRSAVVIGAGIFGVGVADALLRRGLEVTLVEAAEPGHDFSSSGGQTRVIRSGHGDERGDLYLHSARRAWTLWRGLEERLGERLLFPVGCTWLAATADGAERQAYERLTELGVPAQWLTPAELQERLPHVDPAGLAGALHEPEAGVLRAGPAVAALARDLERRGARLVRGTALPDAQGRPVLTAAAAPAGTAPPGSSAAPPHAAPHGAAPAAPPDATSPTDRAPRRAGTRGVGAPIAEPVERGTRAPDGKPLEADLVVWATGAWLGRLFPGLAPVHAARREYLYLEPPADWTPERPVLIDIAAGVYVLPDVEGAGVKVADDLGPHPLDLDAATRPPDPAVEARLRAYAGQRLPSLEHAAKRGGRVCAYELTPDDAFLAGRHPENPDVWLVGGGSGHGFKHGPAFGEAAAGWLLGEAEPPAAFALGERRAHSGATLRATPLGLSGHATAPGVLSAHAVAAGPT